MLRAPSDANHRLRRIQAHTAWAALLRIACLFVTSLVSIAHAELFSTNYNSAKLMKIMAVGDSITDDCSTNGAWRGPLQPLLETNGWLAFTNTGRLISPGYTGFTKRRHEGYCGSVIGPPGVFAVYNYSTTDAYLQRIVRDALTITNNRPDLMLILIGANDIGRGRNPWSVATNDMPTLLNIIFSNVPNAHIMLAKTTTLLNAGIGYGAYATNVPIYNAALQKMVNERRALGQNVSLSDMFSAVDYGTGFLPDHLHPNPVGLRAIASEFAARIQAITIRPDKVTAAFINGGADWKYLDSGQDLGTAWAQPGFDDNAWGNGIARLGYGDLATTTTLSFGPDPTNKVVTSYFRRNFVVPWNMVITNLNVRLARTGGATVWLNGAELYRVNLPAGPLSYTNLALAQMTGFTSHIFYPTNIAIPALTTGTNLLAVEIHQPSVTNASLGFDMELIGSGFWLPLPSLTVTRTGSDLRFSWPLTNGGGFALYSTTSLTATNSWSLTAGTPQTNGGEIVVTQSLMVAPQFFRLQR